MTDSEYITGASVVGVTFSGYADVSRALRKVPPEFYKEVRVALTKTGQETLREASARAAMYSTRIPASIFLLVKMGAKASVSVRASLKIAPHARVMEGFERDPFRHPIYGQMDNWWPQPAHPYLVPAWETTAPRFVDDVQVVLAEVFARAGLT